MKVHCEAGKLQEEKKKSVKVQQQKQRSKKMQLMYKIGNDFFP